MVHRCLVSCFFIASVGAIKLSSDAEDLATRDGPWVLAANGKCVVSTGANKLVKLAAEDSKDCTRWYGHDVRGGRVLFRYNGQDVKWVLHYDPEEEAFTTGEEDGSHFEKKQLFESGGPGKWCLVYDRELCFKLSLNKWTTTTSTTTTTTTTTTSTTTTSTSTTTTSTTTTSTTTTSTTTTVTTTTTTVTTTTSLPPAWVKGQNGESCTVACAMQGQGACLEDKWGTIAYEDNFKKLLEWVNDDTCTNIMDGDWNEFPGQYDGGTCFYRGEDLSDPVRCDHKNFAIARYCPCEPGEGTPAPVAPAPAPEEEEKPSERRRTPKRRRRGKGAKPTTPQPTTEMPTTEMPMTTTKPSGRRRYTGPARRRRAGKGAKPTKAPPKPKPTKAPETTPEPTTTTEWEPPPDPRRRRSRRRAPSEPTGPQWQCSVCGYGPIGEAQYTPLVVCPQCGSPKDAFRKVSFVEAMEAKVSQTTLLTSDGLAVQSVDSPGL